MPASWNLNWQILRKSGIPIAFQEKFYTYVYCLHYIKDIYILLERARNKFVTHGRTKDEGRQTDVSVKIVIKMEK